MRRMVDSQKKISPPNKDKNIAIIKTAMARLLLITLFFYTHQKYHRYKKQQFFVFFFPSFELS